MHAIFSKSANNKSFPIFACTAFQSCESNRLYYLQVSQKILLAVRFLHEKCSVLFSSIVKYFGSLKKIHQYFFLLGPSFADVFFINVIFYISSSSISY